MKKIILAITILALAGSQVQTAKAGGFPIAAGVLGGLAVGTAIGATVAHAPVYYAPGPAYPYYPPVAYRSGPVVYAPPIYVAPPIVGFGFGFGHDTFLRGELERSGLWLSLYPFCLRWQEQRVTAE